MKIENVFKNVKEVAGKKFESEVEDIIETAIDIKESAEECDIDKVLLFSMGFGEKYTKLMRNLPLEAGWGMISANRAFRREIGEILENKCGCRVNIPRTILE